MNISSAQLQSSILSAVPSRTLHASPTTGTGGQAVAPKSGGLQTHSNDIDPGFARSVLQDTVERRLGDRPVRRRRRPLSHGYPDASRRHLAGGDGEPHRGVRNRICGTAQTLSPRPGIGAASGGIRLSDQGRRRNRFRGSGSDVEIARKDTRGHTGRNRQDHGTGGEGDR